jgi:hypothetical protein
MNKKWPRVVLEKPTISSGGNKYRKFVLRKKNEFLNLILYLFKLSIRGFVTATDI